MRKLLWRPAAFSASFLRDQTEDVSVNRDQPSQGYAAARGCD
jgi:hypothetical protein